MSLWIRTLKAANESFAVNIADGTEREIGYFDSQEQVCGIPFSQLMLKILPSWLMRKFESDSSLVMGPLVFTFMILLDHLISNFSENLMYNVSSLCIESMVPIHYRSWLVLPLVMQYC